MKHLALGLGILAILFSLGVWSQITVHHATEEVAQALELGEAEKAKELWDSHYKHLASWLEHRSLNKIDQGFDDLKSLEDCQKLAKQVRRLQAEDRLTYYNLLSCNVYKMECERLVV